MVLNLLLGLVLGLRLAPSQNLPLLARHQLTDIDYAHTRRASICGSHLISLRAREADRHLGHNPREDRVEALVERERRLAAHTERADREESGFCLFGRRGQWEDGGWRMEDEARVAEVA